MPVAAQSPHGRSVMSTPGFGFGRSPFEEFDELMSRYFGGSG